MRLFFDVSVISIPIVLKSLKTVLNNRHHNLLVLDIFSSIFVAVIITLDSEFFSLRRFSLLGTFTCLDHFEYIKLLSLTYTLALFIPVYQGESKTWPKLPLLCFTSVNVKCKFNRVICRWTH